MSIIKLKPTTPGRRNMSKVDYKVLTKVKPEKSLLKPIKKTGGRNNQGRITVRHIGGGHKRKYRDIDFKMNKKIGITGVVKSIEYDPNRTAFIALVAYADGEKKYILAAEGLKVGDKIVTNEKAPVKPGNRMQLENIPPGFSVHNIEMQPGKGGQVVRSAGSSAKLITVEGKYAQVELPSSEVRIIPKECYASVGVVSNIDHSNVKIGKAGRKRWLGVRPTVKGKNMNPCDHPHGGGEGHSPIGMKHPKTPWGLPALGVKTRKKKQSDKFIIRNRKRRK